MCLINWCTKYAPQQPMCNTRQQVILTFRPLVSKPWINLRKRKASEENRMLECFVERLIFYFKCKKRDMQCFLHFRCQKGFVAPSVLFGFYFCGKHAQMALCMFKVADPWST